MDEPLRAARLAMGFMLIKQTVLEQLPDHPEVDSYTEPPYGSPTKLQR